ncbi:hypothetical protein CYMTET_15006 [Cymbomonas tetramitiformis]|uniref:Protein kinase domain-containing protein n=1 Tax=Cymbomonas tetramitiformis TaxID=36881 RepID=A0AAE0GF53_9CHLO|nr:hypothetical protein CYMTET_15006 [Cymbomonas tetramitiformis]
MECFDPWNQANSGCPGTPPAAVQMKNPLYTMPPDPNLSFGRQLGRSQTSIVYLAQNHVLEQQTVVKICLKPVNEGVQDEQIEIWEQELKIGEHLGEHRNLVRYFRGWKSGAHLCLEMEPCLGGTLEELIKACHPPGMEEAVFWRVVRDLGMGLQHMHSRGTVHFDVKPENIFIDNNSCTLKIGDFGNAVNLAEPTERFQEGDGRYLAPELLHTGATATFAADMFSLGAVLYMCATGTILPRNHLDHCEELARFPIISKLLARDPSARPRVEEVVCLAQDNVGAGAVMKPEPNSAESSYQELLRSAAKPQPSSRRSLF